jgi:WD40 repeat protein
MNVDFTQKYVATVGQDRSIRIYDISTGVDLHQYKTSCNEGSVQRVDIDPSGMFVAVCGFDRRIRIHNFYTGECVAVGAGHAEAITSVKFLNNLKQIVSTSLDGCIYVWVLPAHVSQSMHERISEVDIAVFTPQPSPRTSRVDIYDEATNEAQRASEHGAEGIADSDWHSLPAWARKQVL